MSTLFLEKERAVKTMQGIRLALMGAMLTVGATDAYAQHHGHHNRRHGPRYQIDPHTRDIRDSHGQVIGRYQQNVVHQDSTYIVPHSGSRHHGTYYVNNGQSFYSPQTLAGHTSVQPQQVAFGGFSHVDDLSARLEAMSNAFCLDLHYNYSHNPGFQEIYRESYQILQAAKYIHVVKNQHNRAAIQQHLGSLDQLVHHIREGVHNWSRDQHHQVSQLGVRSQIDLMDSTLHHLMNDVGVRPAPVAGGRQAPPPGGGPRQAPPPAGFGASLSSPPPGTIP